MVTVTLHQTMPVRARHTSRSSIPEESAAAHVAALALAVLLASLQVWRAAAPNTPAEAAEKQSDRQSQELSACMCQAHAQDVCRSSV